MIGPGECKPGCQCLVGDVTSSDVKLICGSNLKTYTSHAEMNCAESCLYGFFRLHSGPCELNPYNW